MYFKNMTGHDVWLGVYNLQDELYVATLFAWGKRIQIKNNETWVMSQKELSWGISEFPSLVQVIFWSSGALGNMYTRLKSVSSSSMEVCITQIDEDNYYLKLDNSLFYHNIAIPYPTVVENPHSLNELIYYISTAAEQRLKIRAVGGGYSFSDVAHTDGAFLYTQNLNKVLVLDSSMLHAGLSQENLWKVEAGISVQALNEILWNEGKALINQGGYDKQSIFGALCTGTHGSGITLGSIASTVRSMHIITLNDRWEIRQLQVEPSNGITNRSAHLKKYPDIELIQDDEVFYSCLVSFGVMGITYSVVIEVRNAYWLKEDRVKQLWSKTKQQMLSGLVHNVQYRHIEMLVNPYKETVVLTLRQEVDATTPSGARNIVQSEFAKIKFLADKIQALANSNPEGIPDLIEAALDGTTDSDVINRCYKILNIGPANELPVVSSEVGIDATDISNVINAVDDIIIFLQRISNSHRRYITAPFALRFVKADESFLSMAYGRDTCMIETPMLNETNGLDDTLHELRELLKQKYDGRPHWGQLLEITTDEVKKMYPKFDLFKRVYEDLNISGAFRSAMTKRIGLDD
ncbi:D-arabinono-1,4-lactone oxidase [Egbenema bharatensis]|uniref:D-arabinono-1,4-lactone oxidase n=1 Tax=Egbenema bharatensis TaxID=3463334 RepID=UPI003A862348